MNNSMSQQQKIQAFATQPNNKEIYLVTQTGKANIVVAVFQHIEDACNYMNNLPGMHSIQRRTINAMPTTIAHHGGFAPGWIM